MRYSGYDIDAINTIGLSALNLYLVNANTNIKNIATIINNVLKLTPFIQTAAIAFKYGTIDFLFFTISAIDIPNTKICA